MLSCLLVVAMSVNAPDDFVDSVELWGVRLFASASQGVFRQEPDGSLELVDLELQGAEQHVRALALHDYMLWLGTEAGLILVAWDTCGVVVHRRSDEPVAALAAGPAGLAVTDAGGTYLLQGTREIWRLSRGFDRITWWHGRLVAGDGTRAFEVDPTGVHPLQPDVAQAFARAGAGFFDRPAVLEGREVASGVAVEQPEVPAARPAS